MQFLVLLLITTPLISPLPPTSMQPLYISPWSYICPFYCLNAEKQQLVTIKTSLLSVILIDLLNLFINRLCSFWKHKICKCMGLRFRFLTCIFLQLHQGDAESLNPQMKARFLSLVLVQLP